MPAGPRLPEYRPEIDWKHLRATSTWSPDVIAGLTVAAMLVPQAMAYAVLAGLPPQIGLYAATIPVALYAVFGSSPHLAVGPVAIVSLLTATTVAPLAASTGGSPIVIAALLALVVGLFHIALGLLNAGYLVRLLSHPVLVGFTAAAAVTIAISQVDQLLGVEVERTENVFEGLFALVGAANGSHIATVAVGLASIAVIVALKRFLPVVPASLVVVVLATAVSGAMGLVDEGVDVVGSIPAGLPPLTLPTSLGVVMDLLPGALAITLVGFMESTAVARVYARREHLRIDANRELIALGAANIGAGLFSGMPVTGGFSRTAVQADAGARTRGTGVVVALVVSIVLVAFTPALTNLPTATLGAIVVVAVLGLIDVAEIRQVATLRRSDFTTLVVAFVATLLLGVELGILVAVMASLVIVAHRIMSPNTEVLGHVAGTHAFRSVDRNSAAQRTPGVEVIRFDMSLNYLNIEILQATVRRLVAENPSIEAMVIEAAGVNDIDVSGIQGLGELVDELEADGVELHLAELKGKCRDVVSKSDLAPKMAGRLHNELLEAVASLERVDADVAGTRTASAPPPTMPRPSD